MGHSSAGDATKRAGHGVARDRKVVLLELYSSQGCSSCPPAEELLAELPARGFPRDRVVAAGFHVDYWDRLGWKDPFASERWTKRQTEIGTALRQENLYTPELVWDGRGHGSSPDDARAALEGLLRARPRASLDLDAVLDGTSLAVRGTVAPAERGQLDAGLAIEVLVLEDGLTTRVERGENRGRTLREADVVRDLVVARTIEKASRDPVPFEASFTVPASWRRESLHVAAILREPATAQVWQALDVALVASSS